eukprot:scaffold2090_cov225-Prasinococcus_capsulatus_cf.AAC.26
MLEAGAQRHLQESGGAEEQPRAAIVGEVFQLAVPCAREAAHVQALQPVLGVHRRRRTSLDAHSLRRGLGLGRRRRLGVVIVWSTPRVVGDVQERGEAYGVHEGVIVYQQHVVHPAARHCALPLQAAMQCVSRERRRGMRRASNSSSGEQRTPRLPVARKWPV